MRDPRRLRLLFALAVLTSITLLASSGGLIGGSARGFTAAWMGPLQSAGRALASPIHSVATSLRDLATLRRDNASLKQANAKLSAELVGSRDERARLASLESMLGLATKGKYKIVAARVIAWPQVSDTGAAIQLDVGSRNGIKTGMTVLTGRGLVGSTVAVGRSTSTVRLITDPDSHVGVRIARTSAIGIASGSGRDSDIALDMFSMVDLRNGDAVITRGSLRGVPFVPGVPVGTVVSVGGAAGELPTGVIRPFVNLNALTVVGVVVAPPVADPRDALIPQPVPAPTVTVTATVTVTPTPANPVPSASTLTTARPTSAPRPSATGSTKR